MDLKRFSLTLLFFILLTGCQPSPLPVETQSVDPALLWGVAEGFAVEKVGEGYQFATNIAFVPQPGPDPDDVRYFVTELWGGVKAVTNDGSVHIFAGPESFPDLVLPSQDEFREYGIGGLCLAPEQGYVFVTWATYNDVNHLSRFQAEPGVFGLRPLEETDTLGDGFFDPLLVRSNHQVGGCSVVDGLLYIGVGDGYHPIFAQDLRSFFGKILRVDLDLNPAPGNPYPPADAPNDYRGYVYASGFRNPFASVVLRDGRVYVADNGPEIDRFVAVERGANLGWDGSNTSIGVNAIFTWFPAFGPSRLAYAGADYDALPPEYRNLFYLAVVGNLYNGRQPPAPPGILLLDVDLETQQAAGVPKYLLRYVGADAQGLVAMTPGPDGVYFSPFFPESDSGSALYRLTYDPERAHPVTDLERTALPAYERLSQLACFGCHTITGEAGGIAPSLDPLYLYARLDARINTPEYLALLDALDESDEPFLVETRPYRQAVRAAPDGDARLRTWFTHHLKHTGFDNPNTRMPNLNLSDADIELLLPYMLVKPTIVSQMRLAITRAWPVVQHRHVALALGVGVVLGLGAGWGWIWLRRRRPAP